MEFFSHYCWTWTILFHHKVPLRLSHLGPWIIKGTLKNTTFKRIEKNWENGKNCLIKNLELIIWNLSRTLKTSSWRLKHRLISEVCSNPHQSMPLVGCQAERASGGIREGPFIFCHAGLLGEKWPVWVWKRVWERGIDCFPRENFVLKSPCRWRQWRCQGPVEMWGASSDRAWVGDLGSATTSVCSLPLHLHAGDWYSVRRGQTAWCGSCSDVSKNRARGMSCVGKEVMDEAQRTGKKDTVWSVPVWPCEGFLLLFMIKGD